MALALEQPSPCSGALQYVAVTFSSDLTGLMHINVHGINLNQVPFLLYAP